MLTPHDVAKRWEEVSPEECMVLKRHIVTYYKWSVDPSKLLIACQPWAAKRIIDVSVKGVTREGVLDPQAHILFRINEANSLFMVGEAEMKDMGL